MKGPSITGMSAPEVKATPGGRGTWRFFCAHCRRAHSHGGLGHRWAHCTRPGSPYERSGYVLVPSCVAHPETTVEEIGDSRGWTAYQCLEGCWLGSAAGEPEQRDC